MPEGYCEPLPAEDAWFLYSDRTGVPMVSSGLYIVEGGSRVAGRGGALELRRRLEERIHLLPRFRMRIDRRSLRMGIPAWIDDPDFDLDRHVRQVELPEPGSGRQIRELLERVLPQPMDLSHPLWDMTLVTGLRKGRSAIISRGHHALFDGATAVAVLATTFDLSPEGSPVAEAAEPWRPRPAPTLPGLVRAYFRQRRRSGGPTARHSMRVVLRSLPALYRYARAPGGRLAFNRPISEQRVARGVEAPLLSFRALKKRFGCTVNDGVLAVVAEALQNWLRAQPGEPPQSVRVLCPVNTAPDRVAGSSGNQITGIVVELPVGQMTFEERIQRVARATEELKRRNQAAATRAVIDLASVAPAGLVAFAGRFMATPQEGGAHIKVSNVPGPQISLYLGGARLEEFWPFGPMSPEMGLGLTVMSYAGSLFFSVGADPQLVPDLDAFVGYLRDAARDLTRVAMAPAS